MNLRELMKEDAKGVFLNPDEKADLHDIDGIKILCVIDKNTFLARSNRKDDKYDGFYKSTITLYISEEDLGYRPVVEQLMHVDGEGYIVMDCLKGAVLLEVVLEANPS